MKCHQCNQDSIKIYNKHIICDICGLDIDVSSMIGSHLYDLFFYNENLDEAKKLGIEAYSENNKNPYSINADQVALNNQWEQGYSQEKLSYDYAALSLSSKKIEENLRADIKTLAVKNEKLEEQIVIRDSTINVLTESYDDLHAKIVTFIRISYLNVTDLCAKLLGIKILGRFIRKDIKKFKKEYRKLYQENWEYPI